ncbi:hypothetical protein [Verrucomicrobium sp. BvORR034]|uniref:hypothetical protein n=1 Tax=Verrucomicrobium sp. BvORR034 TaxID=1396418 RepID=UPI000678A84D|nr:hypothetical protein [Verrucomicrobium sp. BvORR034]
MSLRTRLLLTSGALLPTLLSAQVLPSNPQPAPSQTAPASSSGGGGQQQKKSSLLGDALPFMDLGGENVAWDGKVWNVTNNRMFQARLEKYLASPEANTPEDQAYRDVLEQISKLLSPGHNGGNPSLPQAVALLPEAAQYRIDAKLCDSLANAIYGVWLAQKNVTSLRQTNSAMSERVRGETFQARHSTATGSASGSAPRPAGGGNNQQAAQSQTLQTFATAKYIASIAELEARMKANELAMGTSQLTAKAEFQALIIQFALQRRFEHVVLACRFYRHIFSDPSGILSLKEGSDAEKMFASTLGTSPTISGLDAFANEAIRDVDEAVQAFDNLLERGDLASGSKRISEAFMVGEYLPRVRRVPMQKKLMVLDFTRDYNQLISAMEMKDYTLAEQLVTKLMKLAKDFDYSKPKAMIETARTVSDMHLNKAKVSAMQGDQKGSAEALTEATMIWPTNPKLREFTNMIGSNADVKTQAALDLDRLISQRNFRQIYNDQGRYLAAVMDDPQRQESLKKVLTDMGRVNFSIAAATNLAQSSNLAGAWETMERTYSEFPDDPEVSRLRSDFSIKATEFVGALQKAKQHEDRRQTGSALAWYLKAKTQYPPSEFAREGINRQVGKLNATDLGANP